MDWTEAIRDKLGPGRHEILELGAGGGHLLSHLTADFQATAIDLSEQMLNQSRVLNPGVEHLIGDMRSVRLGRKFKAVIIHDAIGYMVSEEDLSLTFATVVEHLEPGGIFITSPDYFTETFHDPSVSHSTRSDGDIELTFIEYDYDPDPDDCTIESIMFYLIRKDGKISLEKDYHTTGLFPIQTWIYLLEEAGFEITQWPCKHREYPGNTFLFVGRIK
ncbi:class I SAM-dependent methyltransferase [Candidatus Latescibacterota bacterium]